MTSRADLHAAATERDRARRERTTAVGAAFLAAVRAGRPIDPDLAERIRTRIEGTTTQHDDTKENDQ